MLSRAGCHACRITAFWTAESRESGRFWPTNDTFTAACPLLSLSHWTRVDVWWLVREHWDLWWNHTSLFHRFIEFGSTKTTDAKFWQWQWVIQQGGTINLLFLLWRCMKAKNSGWKVSIVWSWCIWQRHKTDVWRSMADCWQRLSESVNNGATVEKIMQLPWHSVLKKDVDCTFGIPWWRTAMMTVELLPSQKISWRSTRKPSLLFCYR